MINKIPFHQVGINMQRLLIVLGILLIVIGFTWPWIKRIGLGRLPGDIIIQRGNFTFYFPVTTCIVISVIIMLIWWLLNR
ncbi:MULTISPECIES: DUF2905 domain-containing protein [unclassified Legionella]|uniref:DUF2905 domain-containing protein n=1 Tax=unclassified Legionella TaxID=2622702 RepID=UPI001F5EAABF|nr:MULTISPECIES: DUF2905 domain-containing protein [unclassified Legionella]MDI9818298.1 DUF2905 domain-containing protein [Legionella sp. PL877]